MTCKQFRELHEKATSGNNTTIFDLTVAERAALARHYHECRQCREMTERLMREEQKRDPATEEELAALEYACVRQRILDSMDEEAG